MKRWLWGTNDKTWTPMAVCPHCGSAWSPVVMRWFDRCPFCRKRVHLPKKDYWESMKEKKDGKRNEID